MKTIKVSLNRYFNLEKKRKRPIGTLTSTAINPSEVALNRVTKELFSEYQLAQRRALIIELLKEVYYLDNAKINKEMKGLLVFTNLLYKNYLKEKDLGLKKMPENKGLYAVLSLFGDADEIIEKEELDAEYKIMNGANITDINSLVRFLAYQD